MVRPTTIVAHPSMLLTTLGGAVAMILTTALLFLAPSFGLPYIDFPHLIGGVVTDHPVAAAWVGYWIFFLLGWLVFAPLLVLLWPLLPGGRAGIVTALLKGTTWGALLFVGSGVVLGLLGWVNQLVDQGLPTPGFYALGLGVVAALVLLAGHIVYGITVALIGGMSHGISPLDTIGWSGLEKAKPVRHRPPPHRATHGG